MLTRFYQRRTGTASGSIQLHITESWQHQDRQTEVSSSSRRIDGEAKGTVSVGHYRH